MSAPIISAENLSKRYLIGHRADQGSRPYHYVALRDIIGRELRNAARKTIDLLRGRPIVQGDSVEEFWALKDVNFEVQEGEILGIVGANGAGKSTLLKILSRITEPSAGRVTLRGRVASLLEVGTGFHPELTGRENIYLNGAILGMGRAEIRKKFDDIVAFAEVEKFLDTPVKRFSSGMYVRLAFSVAAHLEPEILVIDEVLAVGDVEFQKKCLGKMDEVSRQQGRTVLFVSHNMDAILKLCSRGMLLKGGSVAVVGSAGTVVSAYLRTSVDIPPEIDFIATPRSADLPKRLRLSRATVAAPYENWSFPFGERLSFDLWIDCAAPTNSAELGIGLFSARGYEVASWTNSCSGDVLEAQAGLNVIRIEYPDLMLLPGRYFLGIGLRSSVGGDLEDYIPEAIPFEITVSEKAAKINSRTFGGSVLPEVKITKNQQLAAALLGRAGSVVN